LTTGSDVLWNSVPVTCAKPAGKSRIAPAVGVKELSYGPWVAAAAGRVGVVERDRRPRAGGEGRVLRGQAGRERDRPGLGGDRAPLVLEVDRHAAAATGAGRADVAGPGPAGLLQQPPVRERQPAAAAVVGEDDAGVAGQVDDAGRVVQERRLVPLGEVAGPADRDRPLVVDSGAVEVPDP
jgi:hypothetical protein